MRVFYCLCYAAGLGVVSFCAGQARAEGVVRLYALPLPELCI